MEKEKMKKYRVYPDLLVKRKIFNQESTIFGNDVVNERILKGMVIIILVINLLIRVNRGGMMKSTDYLFFGILLIFIV